MMKAERKELLEKHRRALETLAQLECEKHGHLLKLSRTGIRYSPTLAGMAGDDVMYDEYECERCDDLFYFVPGAQLPRPYFPLPGTVPFA